MANPPAGAPEPGDEFIELTNYGTTPIALLGFTLDMDGGDVGGGKSCPLPDYTLGAGAHVALVGRDFNVSTYGGVDESLLLRGTLSSFCGALRNSSPNLVILKDGSGRPVSSMTAYDALVPHDEGRSVERTEPAAADVAASYCRSRQDIGPTPGAQNGTTRFGCDA